MTLRAITGLVVLAALLVKIDLAAADQWIEVKSAHFTVLSNAGERGTRKLVWQLEQMRGAMLALWSWAKADLNRPLTVILLKDENSMRALAPQYWEQRGSVRPASLWVSGADRHYLVARNDVEADSQSPVNPYISAYFSYSGLIVEQSLDRDLPFWVRRGFTGVLSNTIVRDDHVLLGPVIPWHLRVLRERPRMLLPTLMSITRRSPDIKQATFMETFDAQTWLLVHFLMFGEEGKRAPQLNAFVKMVSAGKDPAAAFAETIGRVDDLNLALQTYMQRNVFSYQRIAIDVGVDREKFPVRQLESVEAAAERALFHAAMRRPVESRAAIAEARKGDAKNAASYAAEAMLLDQEDKDTEAKTAYSKAVELGTTSAYAHYRLASMTWQPRPSEAVLKEIDGLLSKAIDRNTRYAAAYAWLGEIRAYAESDSGMGLIRRAISLEPLEPSHRLRAAGVLLHQRKSAEARADAQAALALAEDDDDRKRAQDLLDRIAKVDQGGAR